MDEHCTWRNGNDVTFSSYHISGPFPREFSGRERARGSRALDETEVRVTSASKGG